MLGFLDGHWGPKLKSPLLEQWALYPLRNFLQFLAFLLWALLVSRWGWWVHAVRKHELFGRAIALAWTISLISTDSESLYASADHLTLEVATGGPQNETMSKQRSSLLSGCLSEQFSALGEKDRTNSKGAQSLPQNGCRQRSQEPHLANGTWWYVPGCGTMWWCHLQHLQGHLLPNVESLKNQFCFSYIKYYKKDNISLFVVCHKNVA